MMRFHLSTLVLWIVLAGAFVWANTPQSEEKVEIRINFRPVAGQRLYRGPVLGPDVTRVVQGWPFTYKTTFYYDGQSPYHIMDWRVGGANLAIGLASLALVGYLSERLIQRRNPE